MSAVLIWSFVVCSPVEGWHVQECELGYVQHVEAGSGFECMPFHISFWRWSTFLHVLSSASFQIGSLDAREFVYVY